MPIRVTKLSELSASLEQIIRQSPDHKVRVKARDALAIFDALAEYCTKKGKLLVDDVPFDSGAFGKYQGKTQCSDLNTQVLEKYLQVRISRSEKAKTASLENADVGLPPQPHPGPTVEAPEPSPTALATSSPQGKIALSSLGKYLSHYRQLIGMSIAELEGRIKELRGRQGFTGWLPGSILDLEKGKLSDCESLDSLQPFLAAYKKQDPQHQNDMPDLMAEWMVSCPFNGAFVKQSLGDFWIPSPGKSTHPAPAYRRYKIPRQRLDGTDCAFILLELDPVRPQDIPHLQDVIEGDPTIQNHRVSMRALDGKSSAIRELVPHTIPHQHPGDELLFVISGDVFADLEDSGSRTRLKQYDYLHFNSDIPHSVWNPSLISPARILVIRFFQLGRLGSRRRREENLMSLITALDHRLDLLQHIPQPHNPASYGLTMAKVFREAADQFDEVYGPFIKIESWLRSLLKVPVSRARDEPGEILDHVGLAHLLRLLILTDSRKEDDDLRTLLRDYLDQEHGDLTPEVCSRLFEKLRALATTIGKATDMNPDDVFLYLRGQEPLRRGSGTKDLDSFAKYFGIPRVLLDNVLVPAVPKFVVVQGNDRIKPPPYAGGISECTAKYQLPCRALANSDISITFLAIPPSGSCARNRHMGFEFIFCLKGKVKLHLDVPEEGGVQIIGCSTNEYVHYRSRYSHRISSDCETESELFVIRFNELDGSQEAMRNP